MTTLKDQDREVNDAVLLLESKGATVTRRANVLAIILVLASGTPDRLSVSEAAAYCKCPERRIRDAARNGEFAATEISERAISVLRSDLDAWLSRHPLRVRVTPDVDVEDEADLAARLSGAK